jgi:hypothetical protein
MSNLYVTSSGSLDLRFGNSVTEDGASSIWGTRYVLKKSLKSIQWRNTIARKIDYTIVLGQYQVTTNEIRSKMESKVSSTSNLDIYLAHVLTRKSDTPFSSPISLPNPTKTYWVCKYKQENRYWYF